MAQLLYMAMKAMPWDSITVHGVDLMAPPEGPQRFIPVFETREQAEAWVGDDDIAISQLLAPDQPT
jgi:hypothetical protein